MPTRCIQCPRLQTGCNGTGLNWEPLAMTTHSNQLSTTCPTTLSVQGLTSRWTQRYGERHRMTRIHEFPTGIIAPSRVRIYERADHFVLQWWNPAEKRTLNERVDGDLVEAIARARKIDERLEHFRSSGARPLEG